ncbi:MAG: phage holin family protein [Opitutales bacterium]
MHFTQLLKSWILLALGVLIASHTAFGIHYDSVSALVVAVVLLSLCNVFLKPLLMLFSLPFIVLTFGLGLWLINALLFLFVGYLVDGFHVDGFLNALWGALVVSLTSGAANMFFANGRGVRGVRFEVRRDASVPPPGYRGRTRQRKRLDDDDDDDVIDV